MPNPIKSLQNWIQTSIILKLSLWYICLSFATVLSGTSYLFWTLTQSLDHKNISILQGRLQTVTALLERKFDPLSAAKLRIESEWATQRNGLLVKVISPKKTILVQTPGIPNELTQEVFQNLPSFSYSEIVTPEKIHTQSGNDYLAATVVLNRPGTKPYLQNSRIYVALDLSYEEDLLQTYRNRIFSVLLLSLLIVVLIGLTIANSSFKPLREMTERLNKISSSNLNERIPESNVGLELRPLAETFNQMLERLSESFDRLSRFSSDIAHELRTPVNNIQGEIEVALGKHRAPDEYREVMISCLEESNRIGRIIEGLLFLAKTENPETHIQRDRVLLKKELQTIAEFYEAPAQELGLTLGVDCENEIEIQIERTLFQRAIGNIITNAISHTPAGGKILLKFAEKESNAVEIRISDTGYGIRPTALPHVFDRFYRADPSRTPSQFGGFGLGLAITKSIIKLHGGDIWIESQEGLGTTVALVLPRNSSEEKSLLGPSASDIQKFGG